MKGEDALLAMSFLSNPVGHTARSKFVNWGYIQENNIEY